MPSAAVLQELRLRIASIERGTPAQGAPRQRRTLALRVAAIDRTLPGGGLALGALHEVAGAGPEVEHGAAAALFIAGLLARLRGPVLWALAQPDLFAPALAAVGLSPQRVIYVEAGTSVLLAMEEGLRQKGLGGVVGEVGKLGLTASRRLQLAAEASGTIAFALRRSRRFGDPALDEPSAAVTRWRIASLPSPRRCTMRRTRRASRGRAGGSISCAPAAPNLGPGSWRLAMRRVVSLWLPSWPTDRLRRRGAMVLADASSADARLVTHTHTRRRLVVAAADAAAAGLGLHPGMPLAHAQALVPGLRVAEADPAGDVAALRKLAAWCLRYAPLTAADPPDGVWIDVTGCAHLFGGEAAMLADMTARLARAGIGARAAIADTPGAAHAMARYGEHRVVPTGASAQALAPLPIAALRLAPETAAVLRRLGLERIGALADAPRGPLARRFGTALLTRLDQALGRVPEPITPVLPPEAVQHRLGFVEPLLTAEAFEAVIDTLADAICAMLDRAGLGARRLDLFFERVDTTVQAVRIGLARPTRAPHHLARLLVGAAGHGRSRPWGGGDALGCLADRDASAGPGRNPGRG